MSIKEDVQTAQQIVGALQCDTVWVVKVRFPSSNKTYFYKTVDTDINAGDYVVLDTSYSGITVAQVIHAGMPKDFELSNQLLGSCKWIVQKVRFTEYLQLKVNEDQVHKDLVNSMEAKRAQDVLEYARRTFGAGISAVLDEYVGSLSNALALEVPVKKATKRSSKVKE